jgi:hypothetical protein
MQLPQFQIPHVEYVLTGLVALVLAFAIGVTAHRRGHSGIAYFFVSIILSPLFGFLALATVGSRPRGEFNIQERGPHEPSANRRQLDDLARLGVKDPAILDGLGRDQADSIIRQLHTGPETSSLVPLFLLVVFGSGVIFVMFSHFKVGNLLPPTAGSETPAVSDPDGTPVSPTQGGGPGSGAVTFATPAPWAGPLIIMKPVVVQSRYGKVTIPVGTQVTLLSAGDGRVKIQYAGDVALVPMSATNYPQ